MKQEGGMEEGEQRRKSQYQRSNIKVTAVSSGGSVPLGSPKKHAECLPELSNHHRKKCEAGHLPPS